MLSACKSNESTTTPSIEIAPPAVDGDKYRASIKINSECFVSKYYKETPVIFFPPLKLNSDGSLQTNYQQELSKDKSRLQFNSEQTQASVLNRLASDFVKRFDFRDGYYLFELSTDLEKAYFIRFYYYSEGITNGYRRLYLKSSIEHIDSSLGITEANMVWLGEAYFKLDASISEADALKVALKKMMVYAFKDHQFTGTFHVLNL
tara:strand:- start:47 stop:661 length:615 start_codon:yes stop_codon:yes gene_type:complete